MIQARHGTLLLHRRCYYDDAPDAAFLLSLPKASPPLASPAARPPLCMGGPCPEDPALSTFDRRDENPRPERLAPLRSAAVTIGPSTTPRTHRDPEAAHFSRPRHRGPWVL